MNKITGIACVLLFITCSVNAAPPSVYTASADVDFDIAYKNVYQALENNNLFVVFEPDIGANLSGFAKRWGENHNRNKLERFKAMVFCNAWYANEVSNKDRNMVAMCPLHLTMTHVDGNTAVHFVRPDYIAKGTAAEGVAKELTDLVIDAINLALATAQKTDGSVKSQ